MDLHNFRVCCNVDEFSVFQPSSGAVGTEITVSGHNLIYDGSINDVMIMIGLSQCTDVMEETLEADTHTLRCTVGNNEAGYHFVDFTNHLGRAAVSPSELVPGPHRNISKPQGPNSPYPQFFLVPIVSLISPSMGSIEGGTKVTIAGSGFSPVRERMNVLLGDQECGITSSTYTEIVCITSESEVEGDEEVRVTVNEIESETGATYTYSSSYTPNIVSVTPEIGISGSDIQISGENFGNDPSSVSVVILSEFEEWEYGSTESSCAVQSVTDTSITCSLPVKPAGEYQVVVHVAGKGLAASSSTISYELTVTSFSPIECGNGGGVEITITGSGFPDVASSETSDESSIFVLFCSTECLVISSSLTEVKCVLDTPSADSSSTCSDISVVYNNEEAVATQSFEFREDLTPIKSNIFPLMGGTAGGTLVTITGNNLFPPATTTPNEDDIIVTIDSAVCDWFHLSGAIQSQTSIDCVTSEHRTTPLAEVKVLVRGRGFALPETQDSQIRFQYIDRWSSPYTWGEEGQLPKEGDSVLIQKGQIVFLDINTPVLNLILVEGELVFEDSQDLHLQAKYIFINTGKLQVKSRHMYLNISTCGHST